MAQITGTITGVPVDSSYTPLPDFNLADALAGGANPNIQLGNVVNTGNIPRTVTLSFSDAVNCTVEELTPNPIVLAPGAESKVFAKILVDTLPVGSEDTPFSFTIIDTWA